ncbi:exopolysaccharide biosynthesis polyprenyl glycosylphosphotransferase [Horticoccus luteus]|uniref:Exopolysaccharide biosynthesis polyprenyl glycosylphosphotransferase n=1 Tax=Horticoccus luteus TaxID=2862869 RepID=A0A8F9XMP1_9BACT|nr:exopolysaccharide biosynthesis polyprenyl glycosylphosphotransferase [Horticoccus luteus]QYM80471.1 exopolysaccharide biosynthesis polyprenyl glycosylphosphotransferase [Horticoccus luteus]
MKRSRRIGLLFVALDIVATIATFNTVMRLRATPAFNTFFFWPLLVPILALLIVVYLIDGYDTRTDMMALDYTSQHVIALLSAMFVVLLITFGLIGAGYALQSSRAVILLAYVALIPLTLTYRRVWTGRQARLKQQRHLVFIGDEASFATFRAECERQQTHFKAVFAAPGAAPEEGPAISVAEVLRKIDRAEFEVEGIVLREGGRMLEPAVAERLVRLHFQGIPTYTLELFHETYWRKIPLYRLNPTWLFQEGFRVAREPVFERVKRMSDLLLAGFGIVISSPILALAALGIWLEDRGPVFYGQTRIGRHQRPFRLFKLRTMRAGSATGEDRYTRPGDSRITRMGRFLRATRIDEFPQLWSVLKGDMSLIGPRAEWDRLVSDYERQIPFYHFRHMVRPGITGWAQVNYPYGANLTDTLRKLEYDLYYIRHYSFTLDASIVLKTIHTMISAKGSR